MTKSQASARIAVAAGHRRAALRELGKAMSALMPAAEAIRGQADAAPTETAMQMRQAERLSELAIHLETLIGDVGIVFEELQNIEVILKPA